PPPSVFPYTTLFRSQPGQVRFTGRAEIGAAAGGCATSDAVSRQQQEGIEHVPRPHDLPPSSCSLLPSRDPQKKGSSRISGELGISKAAGLRFDWIGHDS